MTLRARGVTAGIAAALFFCGFVALGTWQIERRAWKLALMERVAERVHAVPAAAPAPREWPLVQAAGYEYRHIAATGVFLFGAETQVQAVTELGPGFWVMTPLRTADAGIIWVNRGFVSSDSPAASTAPSPAQRLETVTGLLRMSEPKGGFLRRNDAAGNHWYSRDVQVMAAARGLGAVAPYFIDADKTPAAQAPGAPVGGLTVIAFHNNHLIYAITWYTLALMIPVAIWHARRSP